MVDIFSNGVFTTRPVIQGTFGCAAATHWLAASTSMRLLEQGGNAFDAAAGAGFALQVLEPHLNGPAGEVPVLFYDANERASGVLCGQGVAPQAATIDFFRDQGLKDIPATGWLPACVPGGFGAWLKLVSDRGTLRLADILRPAIEFAGGGFPISQRVVSTIESMRELFCTEWLASGEIYIPGGRTPKVGELFTNTALATLFERIVRESAGGSRELEFERAHNFWYKGYVAETIERACGEAVFDSTGRRNKGLLTAQDCSDWSPQYEQPLSRDYHGYQILKCGAWSQGPAFLQWLGMLESDDIASLDPNGADFVHLLVETGKLCLADRDIWLGDTDAPINDLLSDAYIAQRRGLVGDTCSTIFNPGAPGGRTPLELPSYDSDATAEQSKNMRGVGEPTFSFLQKTPGDTCQISVVDRFGNMVSATPSGGWMQASPVISELGFGLNTRAQMFWLTEGLPSSLAPGKRPRTTLTPTLVMRSDEPYLAFGTPGGDQQEQWSMTFLLRHLHHGHNFQEAIDAPNFHTGHHISSFWPRIAKLGSLMIEGRFKPDVIDELRHRGHNVEVADDWSLGRICACAREIGANKTAILSAAANPRGNQDYAVGR